MKDEQQNICKNQNTYMEAPMKILQDQTKFTLDNPINQEFFPESSLFFDIETTGFSPSHTYVYLIGCAARHGSTIDLTQFFAENPQEEEQILSAFLQLLSKYKSLVSYNGMGFDVRYLKERCALYGLAESLDKLQHLDIYRKLSKFQSILNLQNLKQKSLEKFLDIDREDKYSGGDLIDVYLEYISHPSEKGLSLLLLHNYEDILGMTMLLPLLSYSRMFEGDFEVISHETNVHETFDHQQNEELILTLSPKFSLPKRFSYGSGQIVLTGFHQQAKLKISIYQGELKHFYPNYKDYYYFPSEDRAIHKSVAAYADRAFRKKAKATTCYMKKSGHYLPQYQEIISPCFKQEYQDRITWFDITEEFLSSPELLKKYAAHILKWLSSSKKESSQIK